MTSADLLLRDARASLWADAVRIRGRGDAAEAAVLWWTLGDEAAAEIEPLARAAAECRGQLRTYRQVAILGYAVDTLDGRSAHRESLESGLRWLCGVPPSSAGSAVGFAADPVAMFGIALGLRRAPGDLVAAGQEWMTGFVPQSYRASETDPFAACFWAAVGHLAGLRPELSLPDDDALADVRLGLLAKGILPFSPARTQETDEILTIQSVREALGTETEPVRAAVRLAAFDWMQHAAPIVIPSRRATADDVVALLERVGFALKRWTWENHPRTKGGTARRWHIDNEYHVQNLLWALLAPIFPDLTDEEYTPPLGPLKPRADLGIPSLRLIVEAKFLRRQDAPKDMIEQIAQDASLYLVEGSRYSEIVAFIWDDSARTHLHDDLGRAIREISGVRGVIIVPRPGTWE